MTMIRVKPGDGRTGLLPLHLGGHSVPDEGHEVDGADLFILRRLADGDLVRVDDPPLADGAAKATPVAILPLATIVKGE